MKTEFKNVKVGQKFYNMTGEYIKHNDSTAKRVEDHWKSSPHLWHIGQISKVTIIE